MATSFDPVGLSFANANRPRAELDAAQKRQDTVLGQVLGAAGQQDRRNEFNASMAQRASEQAQSERQFNIVQDLRERQQGLNEMQTMAQISAMKSGQELQALQTAQKIQEINSAPMRQAAQMALYGIVGNAQTPEELNAAYSKLSTNPEITRFVPAAEINQTFLNARQNIAQTKLAQVNQAQQIKNLDAVAEYQELGGDPSLHTDTNGNIDYTSLRNDLGGLKQQRKFDELDAETKAKTNVQLSAIRARGAERRAELDARGDVPDAVKGKVRALESAMKQTFSPDTLQSQLQQIDSLYAPYVPGGAASQTTPTSTTGPISVNKKTGERLQYVNGQWQPIK